MKNIIIYLTFVVVTMSSCSDFLEYKDKDKIIPKSLTHYNEFVYGEIIYTPSSENGEIMRYLPYMTDEMDGVISTYKWSQVDNRDKYFPYFTWAEDPQVARNGVERNDDSWKYFYHKILMCNIVEKEVSMLEDDIKHTKARLLGEVCFMRALSYYYLVNLFGEPYKSADQAKTAKGVPINKNVGVSVEMYPRATLEANYALVERDLLAAIDYFDQGEKMQTKFRPNANVAKLFLSRVYLYSQRYDDVITVTTDLINNSGAQIETLAALKTINESSNKILYNINNPSIYFTWSSIFSTEFKLDGNSVKAYFTVSDELLKLHKPDVDVRLMAYFGSIADNDKRHYYPIKNYCTAEDYRDRAYRLEEVYLNRAEAYIEKGASSYAKGIEDVNTIRRERLTESPDVAAASQSEARELYRVERRIELSFEDHRWFDIRRWGLSITHKIYDINKPEQFDTYYLKSGSANYTLPLPIEIKKIDTSTENIERENTKI